MAIVEMSKLSLIGMENDKDKVLHHLMKQGAVEIIDLQQEQYGHYKDDLAVSDGSSEDISEIENELSRIKWAIDFLQTYAVKQKKGLFAAKRVVDQKCLSLIIEGKSKLKEIIGNVSKYNDKLNGLKNEENRLTNLIASLEPWKGFKLPLEVYSTKATYIVTGTVPDSSDSMVLKSELEESAPESSLYQVGKDKDQSYLYIVFHKSLNDKVNEILKKYGFSRVSFKDLI